jgi:hypothetical protein
VYVSDPLPADDMLKDEDSYVFCNKLVIMLYSGCKFDIVEFLSNPDDSAELYRPKTASAKRRLTYYPDVKVKGFDEKFNLITCHGNYVSIKP